MLHFVMRKEGALQFFAVRRLKDKNGTVDDSRNAAKHLLNIFLIYFEIQYFILEK